MKKIILLFSIVLLATGCRKSNNMKITGELPDKSYDGEWIYLVPLENAKAARVDSAKIQKGKFIFEGKVNVPEIYIIRPRPLLRLSLQEILVVREPGDIKVELNQTSSSGGTALNDSLERWKQGKNVVDSLLLSYRAQYKKTNDSIQQTLVKQKTDSLKKEIIRFNYNFVRNNRTNVVGEMVYKFNKNSFTPEQMLEPMN